MAQQAHGALYRRYFQPVLAHMADFGRRRAVGDLLGGAAGIEQLAQNFMADKVYAGALIHGYMAEQGRFRQYLKRAVENYIRDAVAKAAVGMEHPDQVMEENKRGWEGITPVPGWIEEPGLPEQGIDNTAPGLDEILDLVYSAAGVCEPGRAYETAWVRGLLKETIGRVEATLSEKGQRLHFELFRQRYLTSAEKPPSWELLAREHKLRDGKQARNLVHDTVIPRLRETILVMLSTELGSVERAAEDLDTLYQLLGEPDE